EVRIKIRDVLEIIQVGKSANHAVERHWTTGGVERRRRYAARRYSPKHLEQVHDALLALYEQSVAIQSIDRETGRKIKDRLVHLLDCFGYHYEANGQALDVDDLPADREKVNIGTVDRPLWRVRRRTEAGDRFERPAAILFRVNKELAQEIQRRKGTIGFTLF